MEWVIGSIMSYVENPWANKIFQALIFFFSRDMCPYWLYFGLIMGETTEGGPSHIVNLTWTLVIIFWIWWFLKAAVFQAIASWAVTGPLKEAEADTETAYWERLKDSVVGKKLLYMEYVRDPEGLSKGVSYNKWLEKKKAEKQLAATSGRVDKKIKTYVKARLKTHEGASTTLLHPFEGVLAELEVESPNTLTKFKFHCEFKAKDDTIIPGTVDPSEWSVKTRPGDKPKTKILTCYQKPES
jgi:hypothetical protein